MHDRVKICTHFGLKKGSTVVFNGQHGSTIQSDGYNLAEVEKMFENIYDLYPETHDFDEITKTVLKAIAYKEKKLAKKEAEKTPASFYDTPKNTNHIL